MTTLERIAIDLLGLPAAARALLARQLLASLDDDAETEDVDAAWAEEVGRRDREIVEGTVECRPADDVLRDARKGSR